MTVTAHFDQSSWEKFGLNWIRQAKSEKLKGFIIGHDLNDTAQKKISDLGFEYLSYPFQRQEFLDLCDDSCLLTKCDIFPKNFLQQKNCDVICSMGNVESIDLVTSIVNLRNRADVVLLLREKIEKVYNGLFSARFILGSVDFWRDYFIFRKYLEDKNYFERMDDDLVFNMFIAFFPSFNVKVEKND